MNLQNMMIRLGSASEARLAVVGAVLDADDEHILNIKGYLDGKTTPSAQGKNTDVRMWDITTSARKTGLSRPTIYALIKRGKLPAVEVLGAKRIPVAAVEAFVRGEDVAK